MHKTIPACIIAWCMVMMGVCVLFKDTTTMVTLTWVTFYCMLWFYAVTVWNYQCGARYRTHGTPATPGPKGRTHLRLVTPDYKVFVAGTEGEPTTTLGYGDDLPGTRDEWVAHSMAMQLDWVRRQANADSYFEGTCMEKEA